MKNRKNIFELENRINLRDAFDNVIDDLNQTNVLSSLFGLESMYACLEAGIKTWPYRGAATTINMFARYRGFSFSDRTDEDILYSLELLINLLHWVVACEKNHYSSRLLRSDSSDFIEKCKCCFMNIRYLLEQRNMFVRKLDSDENFSKYVITKRDVDVDAVLETVPELSEILLSYLDIRNQNIEFKKAALNHIAAFLEPKRKQYDGTQYKSLCDDLFYAFNNCGIRHNNDQQVKLPDERQMDLFDEIFKAAVHLMQKEKMETFQQIIKSLKKKTGF